MAKKGSIKGMLIGMAGAFAIAAALNNPHWQDPEGAEKTLKDADYDVVQTGGYDWFKCGKGDLWHTHFVIRNEKGKEVEGTVCKGIWKGSTIRFD